MGEHVVKEGTEPVHLYTAVTRALLIHRFASLGPVRSVKQVAAPFLDAPNAAATICFMHGE
jgi:hypothetical protein